MAQFTASGTTPVTALGSTTIVTVPAGFILAIESVDLIAVAAITAGLVLLEDSTTGITIVRIGLQRQGVNVAFSSPILCAAGDTIALVGGATLLPAAISISWFIGGFTQ